MTKSDGSVLAFIGVYSRFLRCPGCVLLFLLMLNCVPLTASEGPIPPSATKIPKEIVTHGDKRVDDYFWLREKSNPAVKAYLEAENAYTEAQTRSLEPLRASLYREMLGHLKETDSGAPVRRGEYWYYSRTEK